MNEKSAPRLSKLPFIIGDLLLVATAGYVAINGAFLGQWQYVAMITAVSFGAWLMAWPFVLEFRAATRIAETSVMVAAIVIDMPRSTRGKTSGGC